MEKYIEILEQVKSISSTNEKIEKFSKLYNALGEKERDIFNQILRILFDVNISTNIGKKKLEKKLVGTCDFEENRDFITLENFLQFIMNQSSGKDVDILRCQKFLNGIEEKYRESASEIICQTYTFGMKLSLINKALGYTFIPNVKPMLAYSWEKMNDKDKQERYAVTTKLDGCRVLIFVDNYGDKKAYSRNGIEIEGLELFLNSLVLPMGYVYDGELLPQDIQGLDSKAQYKKVMKIVRKKGIKNPKDLTYNIFDMIRIEDYDEETSYDYSYRRKQLDEIKDTPFQKVVKVLKEIKFDEDYAWLCKKLDDVVANGEEGLMLNKLNSKYSFKRSRDIFKLKKFHTCDLRVLRVEKGEGKYKDTLGKIVCDYKGFELGVGSGFSDEQRDYYWNNKDKIIKSIVEISYFEQTTNDKGGKGLRFPVFVGLRGDKNEESYE